MKLLIVGAGEHGQCCYEIAFRMNRYDKISFLDDNNESDDIIGKISDLPNYINEYDEVFIAIGNNKFRKEMYTQAKQLGYTIATLIDPMASVSRKAHIEEGTVVFPCAVIETNAYVSKGCIISSNTTINHDAKVSDFVLIYSNSVVRPRAFIGEMSSLQAKCLISSDVKLDANSYVEEGYIVKCE